MKNFNFLTSLKSCLFLALIMPFLTSCIAGVNKGNFKRHEVAFRDKSDDRIVVFVPKNFDLSITNKNSIKSGVFTEELVPENQSFDNWKEKITISVQENLSTEVTQYFDDFAQNFKKNCGDNFSFQNTKNGNLQNDIVGFILCGNNSGVGEQLVYRGFKSEYGLVTISYSIKTKPFNAKFYSPISVSDVKRLWKSFDLVLTCKDGLNNCISSNSNTELSGVPNLRKWPTNVVPIYDYIVVFKKPFDWPIKPAYQKFDSNYYISEYLPRGQNLDNWKEMLTVSGYKKMDLTPKSYFSALYTASEKICGSKNTAAQIIKEEKDFLLAMLMCGRLDESIKQSPGLKRGQGDITIYKIYKSGNSLYSIFYSWRGKEYDVKAKDNASFPATMDELKRYLVNSGKDKICDKVKPVGECVDYVKISNNTSQSLKNEKRGSSR